MVKRLKRNYHAIPSLDLHGIKHVDVAILVENYIFQHQESCPLKIITGAMTIVELIDAHQDISFKRAWHNFIFRNNN